jgi:high affinity Mn2+ porin
MGNYQESIDLAKRQSNGTIVQPALENTASYKNHKFGFAFNIEQELFSNTGGFFRIGWNNGKSATWMFTEIDNSASIGVVINSKKWHRANDKLGIAYAISGLSRQHQDYLKAGGLGFALGDGKLNYTDERMLEAYYLYTIVPKYISLSGFYQLASNPGYNRDRKGPVNIFSLRLHVAM